MVKVRWGGSRRWLRNATVALLAGCLNFLTAAADAESLKVVTSIRPLALLVEDVAGDLAEVRVLLPGSASPHHYSLRVSDMQRIRSADLLVWVGPGFERFLAGPAAQAREKSLPLAGLPGIHWRSASSDAHEHHHSDRDMHIWLSPQNGAAILEGVANRLMELRPDASERIQQNLMAAQEEMDAAATAVAAELAPVAERYFGVGHDGFGYFVDYFGLRQAAAVSAMPEQGLSARHVGAVLKQLKGASCLVVETTEAPKNVRRLEQLLGIPAVTADPLAADPAIDGYADLIRRLGDSFVSCLSRPGEPVSS